MEVRTRGEVQVRPADSPSGIGTRRDQGGAGRGDAGWSRHGRTGSGGVWSMCGRGALQLPAANDPSSSGKTDLVPAATLGDTASVAYILERGADPRTPESDGETPLHWSADEREAGGEEADGGSKLD